MQAPTRVWRAGARVELAEVEAALAAHPGVAAAATRAWPAPGDRGAACQPDMLLQKHIMATCECGGSPSGQVRPQDRARQSCGQANAEFFIEI